MLQQVSTLYDYLEIQREGTALSFSKVAVFVDNRDIVLV